MLVKLEIENIALVDKCELEFNQGLTVLTGETGAGKSVIVTALNLALGGRAEKDFIRHGEEQARVKATFSNPENNTTLTIERSLSRSGTSKVKVNDEVKNLADLKNLTSSLGEIVGQHASQLLMNEDNHLLFLDRFAGLDEQRENLIEIFEQWQSVARTLKKTIAQKDRLESERELLLFQKNEIEQAQIKPGEENEIIGEKKILDSARTLMTSAELMKEIIDGDGNTISHLLDMIKKEINQMAGIDGSLEKQVEAINSIGYEIEDFRRFIESYGAGISDDPQRVEMINERLDELYRLKKKYGDSEEAILQTLDRINQQLKDRPDVDGQIKKLTEEYDALRKNYIDKATLLSRDRIKTSEELKKHVIGELKDLAIDNSNFALEFIYEPDQNGLSYNNQTVKPHPHGFENASFLFSANPGEPLKSLVKTASGGEISRVLMALKSAERKKNKQSRNLLIFDEVDAGIGGQTANEVGKKLKKLSEKAQLITVTHLHQIARQADHHLLAEKNYDGKNKRTTINVYTLDKKGKNTELKRMTALPDNS